MRLIDLIVIHHSASSLKTTIHDIRKWHVEERGWSAIGYHGIMHADGSWHPGRPFDRMGAHAKGANRNSIGICVVGDNTKRSSEWRPEQVSALSEYVYFLTQQFPGARVAGHREVGTTKTECPGLDIRELLGIKPGGT